jgi:hypothetical protein
MCVRAHNKLHVMISLYNPLGAAILAYDANGGGHQAKFAPDCTAHITHSADGIILLYGKKIQICV